jgi:hypothetical protein
MGDLSVEIINPEIQKICTGAIARGICRSQRDGHYCICELSFGMSWQGNVREERLLSAEEALTRCNADIIYADMALAAYNQLLEELSRHRRQMAESAMVTPEVTPA